MQTPKARPGLVIPKKQSPVSTPKIARKLKTTNLESPVSTPNSKSKTPKDQSPKVVERRSPRSPANEIPKKRPGRISELETQLSQLQEDLKRAKEQLNKSETLKKNAQKEAEESKKQLLEITSSEDSRIEELRKLSQERDKTWQSELEALQKQHVMDSAALSSALSEVRRLKLQLSESDESTAMIQNLSTELGEAISHVDNLRAELDSSRESEARFHETITNFEKQLEIANITVEMLRSEGMKASEAYDSTAAELEQTKDQIKSLEELVENLQNSEKSNEGGKAEVDKIGEELDSARNEISQLKSALEAAETRYHEEYIQSTLQIRNAYEQVEIARSDFSRREAELQAELKEEKEKVRDLEEKLMDNEVKLLCIAEENEGINLKLKENEGLKLKLKENEGLEKESAIKKQELELVELKANLMDKEMELQSVMAQNESLRTELEKLQIQKKKRAEGDVEEQIGEKEEETNTELEAELRRVKVQCDQWRKAAEAAASMLSGDFDGKFVERTGSFESPLSRNMNALPFLEEMEDDDSIKKKNGNMLKKIGVLLKKTQK